MVADGPSIPVLIAIGANLGHPEAKIIEAFRQLDAMGSQTAKHSSLWKTTPVDCPPGSPSYINAASSIWVPSGTSPERFLTRLLNLEAALGRQRSGTPNEARMIDLDLICFGSFKLSRPNLTLPHPRAHLRTFVLAPLAEIEPTFILPGFTKTILQLLERLPDDPDCMRLKSTSPGM